MRVWDRVMIINSQRGFSLLEMSIVTIITSVMIYGSYDVGKGYIAREKYNITVEKLNVIEDTLKLHVKTHGHLPCPAKGGGAMNDAGFGLGIRSFDAGLTVDENNPPKCLNIEENVFNIRTDYDVEAGTFSKGVVPVRSLDLPDDMMFDGWGRRITYIVENKFTLINRFANRDKGQLYVYNAYGATVPAIEDAVIVLISHGESGHGAWSQAGGSSIRLNTAGDNTERDIMNADSIQSSGGNPSFKPRVLMMGKNYPPGVERKPSTIYDDIVRYQVSWQFEIPASLILSMNTNY